ncbi:MULTISPECIES: hypothetical protein [Cyanophyceae]|uniref:hypothetical protein n=1 Tax=Cyanophyceae TaxID=3028117 RepID=UPI001684CE9F|nr:MULTISPECIES: hypothetical protein [Cyanophyceae]MBD1918875.1 hypothetical protein [Phormidium sp. FACHB-77]MBD2033283.1 hypothetical protein [Phormidium sp. FACHB-322]MBD2053784.1 hypothetical protein [Leptolyngbya sp. FACHB-60]
MADIEAGKEYRVIAPSNLHKGRVIVASDVRSGMAMAYINGSPYPFLPGELEAVVPAPPKPKRPTPARRAALYKALLVKVQRCSLPTELQEELAAVLQL